MVAIHGASGREYTAATLAIHADDGLNSATDVAPALHVSTTFRYDEANLNPKSDEDVSGGSKTSVSLRDDANEDPNQLDPLTAPPVYSRLAGPNTTRIEAVLSSLLHGHALTYSSGLSAFHALLVFFRPNNIVIGDGYHGCHGVVDICTKLWGLKKISLHDEASWADAGLGKGDVIHIETPLNPSGEASDLTHYRKKADEFGAHLTVDATFAPPPLQNPFEQGTDMIMHSGTKYFGGHSDMLCGVLAVPPTRKEWLRGLWNERMYLGSVMGSMELWLGLRSLRTLELRVTRQSENATKLVAFLHEQLQVPSSAVANAVVTVQHASLQKDDMGWLKKQMPGGFGPVFSLFMKDEEFARNLPGKLHLFHHATSLGGVESLVEWRRMSDQTVDERVIRVSVGIENWEDLREDFVQAFKKLGA